MARFIPCERRDTILVEVSLAKQLQEGTFEHAVDYVIDHKIDLSIFNHRYKNDHAGRPAWPPGVLLKIILVGYSRGLMSSRDIATACEENIVFMALAAEAKPDFTTIARFISTMAKEVCVIFCEVLLYCSDMGLIGGELFALDGHKISSNAAKELSGKHDVLRKKAEKYRAQISNLLALHRDKDGAVSESESKRIKKWDKHATKIEEFLKENKKRIGVSGKEVQSNITDNESAKMPSSHGVIQGYNGVAVVDSKCQIIVHAEAFGSGQEHGLLKPMLDGVRKNMVAIGKSKDCLDGKQLVADTNYYTEENCKLVEEEKIDAYIPDPKFRKRDPRYIGAQKHKPLSEQKSKYDETHFTHDAENDRWICPAGKELRLEHRAKKTNGFVLREYVSKEEDCAVCPLRDNCLQNSAGKRRYLSIVIKKRTENEHAKRMREKIDSIEGREIYSKRMGIVEPTFGNIRAAKKMDRLTLRGKVKVTTQWMLITLVHNIEKISHVLGDRFEYG